MHKELKLGRQCVSGPNEKYCRGGAGFWRVSKIRFVILIIEIDKAVFYSYYWLCGLRWARSLWEPQCLHMWFGSLWGLTEEMYAKHFAQYLAHSRYRVDFSVIINPLSEMLTSLKNLQLFWWDPWASSNCN